jgi:serine/threonine protein kinase/tetratricopeptide (TPR) repeat protein
LPTELPHTFGRYVLTRLLGEGGMAEVYKASVRVAEGLTKWVVIKKIRQDFADQREFTRMFVDEAKIALSLNHANIVQVFDFGQIRGTFYLAMELIEGLDLMRLFHAVRAQQDAFPAVIAAYVGHQVGSGLAYAHRKKDEFGEPLGIVHRDVSPHNIMMSYEGQVKVLDFGIARTRRAYSGDPRSTEKAEAETIKGKVAYMSPEQAMGRPLDQRSDIYSLGIVLYELLAGELLFRNKDRLEALEQVRTVPLPPLLERAPEIPDELARIVDRALARDPDQRYQTARELQSDLARFLHRSDPVVDDEVLQSFLESYRAREAPLPPDSSALSQAATRDLGDSQAGIIPRVPGRRSAAVLLLHAAFEPRPALPTDPPGDVSPFTNVLRDIAFKREAVVHRLDTGGALLAFGAVVTTGDDAERAVRVARALREAIGETAPGVGLGLAIVATQVGVIRGDDGGVHLALPDGLAEHLERVALRSVDEHIMVASPLMEGLSRSWRLGQANYPNPEIPEEDAGSPWAADFQQVAPILAPLSEAERRQRRSWGGKRHLIGRELELKMLRDNFAVAIRTPRNKSVLIVGEPGFGKRALLDRFVDSLPTGACAVLRGVALWSLRNQPLGVFLEMVRRFLRIDENTDRRAIELKLADYGVHDADKLSVALASALGLSGATASVLDPLERRNRLNQLIRRLVRALAQRRPVLVVIENLHFLDEQSLRVVEEWTEEQAHLPILGISSSRPGSRADHIARKPGVGVITLAELDEQARRELILRRFEDPAEAEELAAAILARTGGNPLFIEEILAALLQGGVIAWNNQGRLLTVRERGARIDVPPSIEGALQGRVDELSPGDREALQAASVLGSRFRAPEVAQLIERDVATTLPRLTELGFIEKEAAPGPDGDPLLRFATISLHEVCKSTVPLGSLEQLHGRAAEIKLARRDYTPGRDDGPIADHLVHAGRLHEAVDPALRAAENAESLADKVDAYYHLTQALKAMRRGDPRRFDVLLQREPILRAWGRRRAQGADIRQLIGEAEATTDPREKLTREVQASLRLLRFYLECGRAHRGAQLVPRMRKRIEELRDPAPYRWVLAELESEILLARGLFDEAEAIARDAIAGCGDAPEFALQRCLLLANLGEVQLSTGRHSEARGTFTQMLELARELKHRRLEARALNSIGEVEGRATRYQQAVDCFHESLAIDRDLGDRFATGTKLANLGLTFASLGLHRRAERYLRKALELHEAIGHPALLNDVMVKLGHIVAELGDPEGAEDLLVDAARVARGRDDVRTELRAEVLLAGIVLDRARSAPGEADPEMLARAEEMATSALERARAEGLRTSRVRALHVIAHICAIRGDTSQAIEHQRVATELVRAGAAPLDGVLAINHLGRLLDLPESKEESRALLVEAADKVQARLDELRDDDLRRGYERLEEVQQILSDGERARRDSAPQSS